MGKEKGERKRGEGEKVGGRRGKKRKRRERSG